MSMLERIKMKSIDESMVDFKIRSKLYLTQLEAMVAVEHDFEKKVKVLFPEAATEKDAYQRIKVVSVSNPMLMMRENPDLIANVIEKYGQSPLGWDEDCEVSIYYTEIDPDDDEDEMPNTWMFKYEVYVIEDEMKLTIKPKNGDYIFKNVATYGMTSTYH